MSANLPHTLQSCFTPSGERLLPISVVAEKIGTTTRTIRNMIRDGRLIGIRRGKKLLFCTSSEVERFLRIHSLRGRQS